MGAGKGLGDGLGGWIQIYGVLWKQYWLKHRFWIVFLLLCAFLGGQAKGRETYRGLLIGICAEDEKGAELLAGLQEENSVFRFLPFGREEEMIRQIENGTLECGYTLPYGFFENILKGKRNRQIILYTSPASSVHKISYEAVFADLFQMLSPYLLENYWEVHGFSKGQERLLALNDQFLAEGGIFHFVYERVGEGAADAPENLDTLRGIGAELMFIMSLLGMGNVLGQVRTWDFLPGGRGRRLKSAGIHIAVTGSILTGGACLWLSGTMGALWRECAALLLYGVLLEIFLRLLGLFVKKEKTLYGMLPGVILCSLIFCPVLIRIERYLPWAAWISRCFPPAYYLKLFLA